MKKLLAAAAGLAASFGISNAVIIDFEGYADVIGVVNVNPVDIYTEEGYRFTPINGQSAVFDSASGSNMIGRTFSDVFGFSGTNEITIVQNGGGSFDLRSLIAGPLTFAGTSPVSFTAIANLEGPVLTQVSATFALTSATTINFGWTGITSLVLVSSDDMSIDNLDVSSVPVPAALPLFGAALAGFAATRRRKSAA